MRKRNRIREIREQKEITMTQVARDAQISTATLHDIEVMFKSVKPATYRRIASALGVGYEDLRIEKES